jgi:hypothetical protein
MGIVLIIADLLVLLAIVISVSRAVRGSGSLLTVCIVIALLVFATVSFTAASGLAQSSAFNQGVLFAFLIVTAIVARVSWAPKS